MPDVPTNLILGHVGPSVIQIQIHLEYKKITIHLFHHLEMLHISYMIHGNGHKTLVFDRNRENRKKKFIENVDYMEGFWNDYNIIKKFQNQCLQKFELVWSLIDSPDVDDISKFLEQYKNSRTIKTQHLSLGIYHGDEIPIILQHLDANCLNYIRFFRRSYYDKNIDFTEIAKLDQWKNAQTCTTQNLPINATMKHFTHLSYIDAEFQNSDAEDLKGLTEGIGEKMRMKGEMQGRDIAEED
ncbi:hypothetical protein L5515_009153 [Caenorhabditis briggsae]|uniref:DUF38 domain-containing protein n=1 Tax=Caenorhabditis briggsae TaxID=6238 RepID=A0AAE9FAR2_CAEBR|nr:hypothetical protein L5515_009153 [Caenorhabditis briggsae]